MAEDSDGSGADTAASTVSILLSPCLPLKQQATKSNTPVHICTGCLMQSVKWSTKQTLFIYSIPENLLPLLAVPAAAA